MTTQSSGNSILELTSDVNIQSLWAKYEDIAMHFNDLLIQLRIRSLAGVAVVSTLIGVFADGSSNGFTLGWLVAASFFVAMAFIWAAIYCLDIFYYNKLLNGAVAALKELENFTVGNGEFEGINLSTKIIAQFDNQAKSNVPAGVHAFYGIVFLLIFAGSAASYSMFQISRAHDNDAAPTESEPPGQVGPFPPSLAPL